jgi:hypothetical protein
MPSHNQLVSKISCFQGAAVRHGDRRTQSISKVVEHGHFSSEEAEIMYHEEMNIARSSFTYDGDTSKKEKMS